MIQLIKNKGTYDNSNVDVSEIQNNEASARVMSRLNYGEEVKVSQEHNGEMYAIPFRRYYIIMSLNHGLARTTDCLPANMAVNLRFHRANAECALLKISDTVEVIKVSDGKKHGMPLAYEETVIPIKNPLLHAYYAYSHDFETTMARVRNSNMEIPFMG